MGTVITLFICSLIVPLTMLVFGVWMRRRPPKEVGGAFGYRTRRSTKNAETWRFAHEKCGKVWTWGGLVLLVVTAGAMFLLRGNGVDAMTKWTTTLSMAQVVALLASVVPVERALKKHFDDNGNPRD